MRKTTFRIAGFFFYSSILAATNGWAADHLETYQITLTNLTPGQPIAPLMAATHRPGISFFKPGKAASPELASLAEAGDGKPLATRLMTQPGYRDARVATMGTPPGKTTTLTVTAEPGTDRLSLGAMLGNTNDAFIALRDVKLPSGGKAVTYLADAYDAGSETNDESCNTVPGPACGGMALSPDDQGEGFVHIHNGIHGVGGLSAATYDWRNPTAQIVIKRMK